MSFTPLDIQVAFSQMENAGNYMIKTQQNETRTQIQQGIFSSEQSQLVQRQVRKLSDELAEYQQSYLDSKQKKELKERIQEKRKQTTQNLQAKDPKHLYKGLIIDYTS